MRTKYCREHIDITAVECCIDSEAVRRVKVAADFEDEHPLISGCSTDAIQSLIRVKNPQVQEIAILLVEKALKQTTPTGGRIREYLTEKQVRTFIDRAEKEIQAEFDNEVKEARDKALRDYLDVVKTLDTAPESIVSELKRCISIVDDLNAKKLKKGAELDVSNGKVEDAFTKVKQAMSALKAATGYRDAIRKEFLSYDDLILDAVKMMNKAREEAKK